jgi:hypothetical protein
MTILIEIELLWLNKLFAKSQMFYEKIRHQQGFDLCGKYLGKDLQKRPDFEKMAEKDQQKENYIPYIERK